jgi:integrase
VTPAIRKRSSKGSPAEAVTLASMLAALDSPGKLSATRRRDLRSAVKSVANLLGDEPAALPLDIPRISARLNTINPLAAGMTAKRLANIRSDFLAATRFCGVQPVTASKSLRPEWAKLFERLSGRRARIGLSRFVRYASARGIKPGDVNDDVVAAFIEAVRNGSLHRQPNRLHRQVTLIWNEVAARVPGLGLQSVTVASFRGPPERIAWSLLPAAFKQDVESYFSWAGGSDPFDPDARVRPLASGTLRLRHDQIQAALTALADSGANPLSLRSLADLVTPNNLKSILRQRLDMVDGGANVFNHLLAHVLLQIAREWVKVDPPVLAELKKLVRKVPVPPSGLTTKNKRFLRQFDDPDTFCRLVHLPDKLWAEVKRDSRPSFRTLAKAHVALAIAILTYLPVRLQNLTDLTFDTHLFLNAGARATSTLELSNGEVKNRMDLAFDVPPRLTKMLLEYRDRVAPKIIGFRPKRLFVNRDGTPKSSRSIATMVRTYASKRAGIALSPHQFRHLSAKILLDSQPGAFEIVRQLLGHKNEQTTVNAYAGIDSRRAARHHQRLIEDAIEPRISAPAKAFRQSSAGR